MQAGTGAEPGQTDVTDMVAEVQKTGVLKVVGSLSSYMMRLGDEYTKSLQSINPHTQEYIRRLKDESVVVELAGKVQVYYERQQEMGIAADLALLQVRDCCRCFCVLCAICPIVAGFYIERAWSSLHFMSVTHVGLSGVRIVSLLVLVC